MAVSDKVKLTESNMFELAEGEMVETPFSNRGVPVRGIYEAPALEPPQLE